MLFSPFFQIDQGSSCCCFFLWIRFPFWRDRRLTKRARVGGLRWKNWMGLECISRAEPINEELLYERIETRTIINKMRKSAVPDALLSDAGHRRGPGRSIYHHQKFEKQFCSTMLLMLVLLFLIMFFTF